MSYTSWVFLSASIERFIGVITEHFAGAFPTWLAPVQVKVMAMTDRTRDAVCDIAAKLEAQGIRVETDLRNEKIGFKIREAQMQKIPYMLIVGGHNEKTNLEIVKLTIATVRRLMEEEPRYRAVLKKQVKAADGTIDISWINEDLITFVKDRLGHDQRYAIDPTKITNALGWYPETKFEVGIVKTIEWYLNNQPWVEEVTSGDYQKYYEQMYGGRG